MAADLSERRYLAALRFVDGVTGSPIREPLVVDSQHATFHRNRSGLYVVSNVPALFAHTDSFEAPPPVPALASVVIQGVVYDQADQFIPRRFQLALPRPADREAADSLFKPVDVALYPSPRAQGLQNWAVVRASLRDGTSGEPLPASLVRIVRQSDDVVLARGMAEPRQHPGRRGARATAGELLVLVPNIPITIWGDVDEPVVVHEVATRLEVVPLPSPDGVPPDPDAHALSPARAENRFPLRLAAGRTHLAGVLQVQTA